jgi:hypothetical protein
MLKQTSRLLLSLAVAIAGVVSTPAQLAELGTWQNGVSEPWNIGLHKFIFGAEFVEEAMTRWRLVASDSEPGNEWVGDYYRTSNDEMRLSFLRWAPRAGFVLAQIHSCSADVNALSFGSVRWSPEIIHFDQVPQPAPNETPVDLNRMIPTLAASYLPVTWGGAHYLVPENRIDDFCLWAAGLGEGKRSEKGPIEEYIFSKRGEDPIAEPGLPVVPPGYERFVRIPIDATIVRVGRSFVRHQKRREPFDQLVIPVVLNVGREDNVRKGLSFNLFGQSGGDKVIITIVSARSARGEIIRLIDRGPNVRVNRWGQEGEHKEPITVGMPVSTSWHK